MQEVLSILPLPPSFQERFFSLGSCLLSTSPLFPLSVVSHLSGEFKYLCNSNSRQKNFCLWKELHFLNEFSHKIEKGACSPSKQGMPPRSWFKGFEFYKRRGGARDAEALRTFSRRRKSHRSSRRLLVREKEFADENRRDSCVALSPLRKGGSRKAPSYSILCASAPRGPSLRL